MALLYIIKLSPAETITKFQDGSTRRLRDVEIECLQFLFGQAASHATTKKEWYRLSDMIEQLEGPEPKKCGTVEVSDEDLKNIETAIGSTAMALPTNFNVFGGRPGFLNKCVSLLRQFDNPTTKAEFLKVAIEPKE